MSETLNPISSFEYPTDEQFTELREVGQDLLKKDKQKQIEEAELKKLGETKVL